MGTNLKSVLKSNLVNPHLDATDYNQNAVMVISTHFLGNKIRADGSRTSYVGSMENSVTISSRIVVRDANGSNVAVVDLDTTILDICVFHKFEVAYDENKGYYTTENERSLGLVHYECDRDYTLAHMVTYLNWRQKEYSGLMDNYTYSAIWSNMIILLYTQMSLEQKAKCSMIPNYDFSCVYRDEVFFRFSLVRKNKCILCNVSRPGQRRGDKGIGCKFVLQPQKGLPQRTFMRIWLADLNCLVGVTAMTKIIKRISILLAYSFDIMKYFNMDTENFEEFSSKGNVVNCLGITFVKDFVKGNLYYRYVLTISGVNIFVEVSNTPYI